MDQLNKQELDLIGHSLGVNIYHAQVSKKKRDKKLPEKYYRNYFCAGTDKHSDYPLLAALRDRGLMSSAERMGHIYFYVTDEGKKAFENAFQIAM